jgi:hypothetical protein
MATRRGHIIHHDFVGGEAAYGDRPGLELELLYFSVRCIDF